ncbi:DUF4214 domain-containing protein [[Empedobacter] haloabium]|uniref:DUF4214 domain-containing protein n=1 Tax=[Empedobacter] haloabium TaxID=592317 RepID=A0ABZ1UJI4_9BURK
MVAIVGGNGLGVQNSSAGTLGSAGLFGNSTHGATKEAVYVNAANGNLVINDRDEWLVSLGVDVALTRTYNSQGNLSTGAGSNWMTGPAKRIESLTGTLNKAGSTVTRIDSDGSSQLYTYDAAAKVYRSTDGDGAHDTLLGDATGWTWLGDRRDRNGVYERYDLAGRIIATGEKQQDSIKYTYNGAGQLETVTDQTGDVSRYEYANGNLVKIRTKPANGQEEVRTYYEYDAQNRLAAVVIDMSPQDGSIADGQVYRTSYQYWDTSSRLKQVRQSDNTTLNFIYDDLGRVASFTDEMGRITRFDYATPGRTTVTEPGGNRVTYAYDDRNQLTTVTRSVAGTEQVTSFFYDGEGNVVRTVSPAGLATVYEYDTNGNRVLERDADGRTVRRQYSSLNYLNNETSYSNVDPDSDGPSSAAGAMTRHYVYDAAGRIRFIVSPLGKVTEYRYNAIGQIGAELDYNRMLPSTTPLNEGIDAWAQRVAEEPNSVASRIEYSYNARGSIESTTTYSAFQGRKGLVDGTQTVRRFVYDQAGQLLSVIVNGNPTTTYTYDELGRQLTQTEADGTRKVTTYRDAANQVTVSSYAKGDENSYLDLQQFYDASGALLKTYASASDFPGDTGTVQFDYDASGRLRATRDSSNNITHMLYDTAGRKVAEIVGKSMVEYLYDYDGRLTGTIRYAGDVDTALLLGSTGTLLYPSLETLRPTTLVAANRRTWNSYDAGGRLVASVDANRYLTRFEYDGAGHLVRTIARATQIDSALLEAGRIPASHPDEAADDDRISRTFYDNAGKVVGKLDGAGYLTELVYDPAGRLVDTITSLQPAPVELRATGSLASLRPGANDAVAHQRNFYDGKGQVVGIVDAANYLTEITYDAAGNVSGRRQYAIAVATPTAATLGELGAQVSADDHVTLYTYNAMNQVLTETAANGDIIRYGYDARGRQVTIARSSPTTTERISTRRYDTLGRVIAELSPEGTVKLAALPASSTAADAARIWSAYGISYTYDSDGRRTSMTDQLNNQTLYLYDQNRLAVTIDAAGNWERYAYDAFGDLIEVARYVMPISWADRNRIREGTLASLPTSGAAFYTKYYYDNDGRKVYTANADGSVQKTEYNAFDDVTGTLQYQTPLSQVVEAIRARGHTSGAQDDLAKALAGTAASQRAYYDTDGRLVLAVDANGNVEGRTYSARDTVATIRQYGKSGSAAMDVAALLALADNSLDRTQSFTYDVRGLRIGATDPMGYRTVTGYNAFGQADKVARYGTANNAVAQTLYDSAGRTRATVSAAGTLTALSYDAEGRIVEQVTYAKPFDSTPTVADIQTALSGKTLSIAADDARQRFVYDKNGRLAATLTFQTAGVSNQWTVTSQSYDKAGRLIQRTSFATPFSSADLTPPDDAITAWIADPARATEANRASNSTVVYIYDTGSRIVATATAQRGVDGEREWAIAQNIYNGAGLVQQRIERATPLKSAMPTAAQITALASSANDAVTINRFDAMGRVIASAKSLGVAGEWALTTREYDTAGNLLSVREHAVPLTNVTLASSLKGSIDERDRLTRYSYDAGSRLVATVDAAGSAVRLEYDARGNVISSTRFFTPVSGTGKLGMDFKPASTSMDRVTRTFYDKNNHPSFVIDAEGAVTFRRYDGNGNVTVSIAYATKLPSATINSLTSAASLATLMTRYRDVNDRIQYFAYYPDGRLRHAIDALGYMTGKDYDSAGRVVRELAFPVAVTMPSNPTDAQIRTAGEQARSAQLGDSRTRATTYDYDAGGNLATVTDALGNTERYTYDGLGRKSSFTNKLGASWTYEYDAAGRLVKETSPEFNTLADGLAARVGDWGMQQTQALVTKMEYDVLGNLVRRTEAAGIAGKERSTEYRYDAVGRQIQTVLPAVSVYDEVKDTRPATGEHTVTESLSGARTVTVRYDALGNAVSNVDVGGNTSYKVYDKAGHVRFEVDAKKFVTAYRYDNFGQVSTMTRYANTLQSSDADLATISDSGVESLLQRDGAKDRTISYGYDAGGRKTRTSEHIVAVYDRHSTTGNPYLSAGRTTINEYNAFGEVFRQSVFGALSDGTPVTQAAVTRFYYTVRGEKSAQIAALSDVAGQRRGYLTTYAYDAAGNLQERLEYANEFGTWTDTTYDGYATSEQDRHVAYKYDALNRKTSEIKLNVTYADSSKDANLVEHGSLTTQFDYDAIGNQISVIDAVGGQTLTYFDKLGHTIAVAHKQASANGDIGSLGTRLTEFKVDVLGNVVMRIDYADSAPESTKDGASEAMRLNPANRITATRYDNWGRALETLDAEQFATGRQSTKMSYDVYGRVVKQWRAVTSVTGAKSTSFQVMGYDLLGRVTSVLTPGLVNLIDNVTGPSNKRVNEYNAFGEMTSTYLDGMPDTKIYSEYDQAGNIWLTNNDKNVHTVRLYDVQGNATAVIQSTSDTPDEFQSLDNANEVLAKDAVLRTENRYDLLNHLVDSRLAPDSHATVLVRQNEKWVRKVLGRDESMTDSLLVIGGGSDDAGLKLGVRYRLPGAAWSEAPDVRIRVLDGTVVFDTGNLPAGDYEYEIMVTPPGELRFARSGGQLRIAHPADPARERQVIALYLMLFGRAPDLDGLNWWLEAANRDGLGMAALFASQLASDEVRQRLTGTPDQIMAQIFQAFGSTATPEQLARWAQRYTTATVADGSVAFDQRGLALADLLASVSADKDGSGKVLNDRVAALHNFVFQQHGNDAASAAKVLELATTDLAGALAKGNELGALERSNTRLIELYIALFGRAPDLAGLGFWTDALTKGATLEHVAEQLLASPEAGQAWLYPSAGLTATQYNRQLVSRAYRTAIDRQPSEAELNDWLAKLNSGALSRAQFALQLVAQIGGYKGSDGARLADRAMFANKVSVSYTAVVTLRTDLPVGADSSALLKGITSAATAQEAAQKAILAAGAAAAVASATSAAASIAGAATPMEDTRRGLVRLYATILGRVPDRLGFDTYLSTAPYSRERWTATTLEFLNSSEAKGFLGDWTRMDNRTFVAALYRNALGSVTQGPRIQAEMDGFVKRLQAGASPAQVAYDIATGMLQTPDLDGDDAKAKALLDNRTAVGLSTTQSLSLVSPAIARTVLSLVTATDMSVALNSAYSGSQDAITAKLDQLRGAATSAVQLADALSEAAGANVSAVAIAETMKNNPAAVRRLQLTQLYVALLGRSASNPPDVVGVQYYTDNTTTSEQVIQSFFVNKEGLEIFPTSLGNAAFVDRVVEKALGSAGLIGSAERNEWTGRLSTQSREKVALDIVNHVINYTVKGSAPVSVEFLTARAQLLQRVADAFVKLDENTAAEVSRIKELLDSSKRKMEELAAPLAALKKTADDADQARAQAASAAASALESAYSAGDATGSKRLLVVRMYATLLKRAAGVGPTLDDTTNYLPMTEVQIAKTIIESAEGKRYFPDNSSNADFVRQLYGTVLGRPPTEGDISSYSNMIVQNSRAYAALYMVRDFFNYSDGLPDQLLGKKTIDDTVAGFLLDLKTTATDRYRAAATTQSWIKELDRANQAVATADKNIKDAEWGNTYGMQWRNGKATRKKDLIEIYAALRGFERNGATYDYVTNKADYEGVMFWVVDPNKDWRPGMIDKLLDVDYPADPRDFVLKLYRKAVGRTNPSEQDVRRYVAKVAAEGRRAVAEQLIVIGKSYWTRTFNDITASLDEKSSKDIQTKANADAEKLKAESEVATAKTNLGTNPPTLAAATDARDFAYNLGLTMVGLFNAHPKVITADEKYIAAADARKNFNDKDGDYKKAAEKYQETKNTLDRYQAVAALGDAVRKANSAYATAAAKLPAMLRASTTTNVQAQRITQLYFTLLNRGPTLPELYLAQERIASGTSLTDIAATLLKGEGASLYPSTLTNEAFVRQLYNLAFSRVPDDSGLNNYIGELAQLGRAELSARFVISVADQNNGDTRTVNDRSGAWLRQLAAAPVANSMVDAVIDAGAEAGREKAAKLNATAAAALAASPDAQRITQLTRLYVTLLNRTPDIGGLNSYARMMRAESANTMAVVAQLILDDVEAQRLYPASMSDSAFVAKLYELAIGRPATGEELAQFTAMLPARTRGQVACAIIDAVLGYNGTDRLQQAAQLGFAAKLGAALNQVAALAKAEEDATRSAVTALDRSVAAKVRTMYLGEPTASTTTAQQANVALAGNNLITVDRWGNVIAMADQRNTNYRVTYRYNHENQLIGQTQRPAPGKEPASANTRYDALGRVAAQVDYNGNKNTTTYDSEGNAWREYHADGGIVESSYNLFGNRLTVRQPGTTFWDYPIPGVLTTYRYDYLGHLLTTQTEQVDVYEAVDDGYGPLPSKPVGSRSLVQRREYDELGRVIRSINSDNTGTQQEYDANGNVISTATVDLRNGRLYGRTVFAYDSENHKIASKDANNKSMKWEYAKGRMTASFDMENKRTGYSYDQAGRLVSQVSERGQKLYYTFTGANLTRIEDAATMLTTHYAYDANGNRVRERQVYLGNEEDAPPQLQNNTLRYDAQNRLVGVLDDKIDLTYSYDANGNRVKIVSRYDNGEPITRFNAFDAMNRQTIVNGDWVGDEKTGHAVRGSGHEITYDKAGNRETDTYNGTSVITSFGSYSYQKNSVTTETYRYDRAGRLSQILRDGLLIDERHYDAGSRISQSGLVNKGARGVADVLKALGIDVAQQVYTYNAFGRTTRQKNLNANLDTISDTWFGTNYDAMGNLTGYDTVPVKGDKGIYRIEYSYRDSYKEFKTTLAKDNSEVTSEYDVNGNRIKIFDSKTGTLRNRLWYDAEGHVQAYMPDGTKTPTGTVPHFNLIVNGNVLGEENGSADNILGSNYMPLTNASLSAPPSSYSVQSANETLQSIAQTIWGDANLWYLIADANALTAESKLEAGSILRIPARVNTVHGDYDTYKPYNPTEQIGNTAPVMPPPRANKGCGVFGQVIQIAIAIVANTFGGPVLASIASQLAGMAMGVQDKFSWKAVALAAVMPDVGQMIPNADWVPDVFNDGTWKQAAARAAVSNMATQAVSVATGLQDHFQWRNVAAAAAGAGAGFAAAEYLKGTNPVANWFGDNKLGKDTTVGFVRGMSAAMARGGKIEVALIATDAFGNALASSLSSKSSVNDAERKLQQAGVDLKSAPRFASLSTGDRDAMSDVPTLNDMTAASARSVAASVQSAEDTVSGESGGTIYMNVSQFKDSEAQVNVPGQRLSFWGKVESYLEEGFGNFKNGFFQGVSDASQSRGYPDVTDGTADKTSTSYLLGTGFGKALVNQSTSGVRMSALATRSAIENGSGSGARKNYAPAAIEFDGSTQQIGRGAHNAAAAQAPFSKIVPGGGLQTHEAAGGHLILKHVGQTEQSLVTRLANEPRIIGSSSYYDRGIAENAVSQALDANQTAISTWLNGSAGRLRIDHTLPNPVGISVSRGATSAIDVNSTRTILVRDPSMPTGYKILTGFPTTP